MTQLKMSQLTGLVLAGERTKGAAAAHWACTYFTFQGLQSASFSLRTYLPLDCRLRKPLALGWPLGSSLLDPSLVQDPWLAVEMLGTDRRGGLTGDDCRSVKNAWVCSVKECAAKADTGRNSRHL